MKLLRAKTNISVTDYVISGSDPAAFRSPAGADVWVCFGSAGVRDPPAALTQPADGQSGSDGGGSGVWECEWGSAGLLLSGLESLGAPAAKQSQLCLDRPAVDVTVPSHFQSQEFRGEKCLLVRRSARNNSGTSSHSSLKQRRLVEITQSLLTLQTLKGCQCSTTLNVDLNVEMFSWNSGPGKVFLYFVIPLFPTKANKKPSIRLTQARRYGFQTGSDYISAACGTLHDSAHAGEHVVHLHLQMPWLFALPQWHGTSWDWGTRSLLGRDVKI